MRRFLSLLFRRGPAAGCRDALVWGGRALLRLPPAGDAEAFVRLAWRAGRRPRRAPGEFRFRFGAVRFVDGLSFLYQFEDIFLKRAYDFDPGAAARPFIVDLGGNVGTSAIWFKQRFPDSRILVFEADPAIAAVLEENRRRLGLRDVELVAAAAWTANGEIGFAPDGADGGRVSSAPSRSVPAVRVADRISEPVDLLKIDIEGAEFDVLADLCATGRIALVRRIVCELHQRDGGARTGALLSQLAAHGFRTCLGQARCAPDLPGSADPGPFSAAPDGKCLVELYAWRA